MKFDITIDTGGTFTDGLLVDQEEGKSTAKSPTDVADPVNGVMECIELLAQGRGLTQLELLANTNTLVIGSTIATNCLLDKGGAKCCLLYTKGFRDIPELGRRIPKDDIYNLKVPPPRELIPRHLRFGVEERIQYDGKVVTPLNQSDVLDAVRKAKKYNVEVPVICFLHSYINPVHEEKAAEIMKAEYPNAVVSSHILRRWIEWDRYSTASIAAYVKPKLTRFVTSLAQRLKADFKGILLFITCSGGVATPEVCLDNPALLIGSGPAAGPLFGRLLAEAAGCENIMVCDMGGTSLDVGLLPKASIITTTVMRIGDYRNACDAVDVVSIGAGGGGVAWLDERGLLRVGPQSAGADPGPACYNKGGQMPTVTDADVTLGYIPSDYFLGGTIPLDTNLAEKVIEEKIARPLKVDVVEAAYAIASLVEANMTERIILEAVAKGYDPRYFVPIVAGGAGPVHAIAMTARLGVKELYIPRHAAVFCALGIAAADYKYVLSRFFYRRDDETTAGEIGNLYESLEEEGTSILARQGTTGEKMRFIRGAEIQYYGQIHHIDTLLPETRKGEPFTEETLKALIRAFHEKHQAIFGWSDPSMPVLISMLKLQAIAKRRPIALTKQPLSGKDPSGALKRQRQVYFKELGGFVETPCYDGARLRPGNAIKGPAIVEEVQTTLVLPPEAELNMDAYGNYDIRRK